MDPFTLAWLLWIGAFLAVEGVALFNTTDGDTLSEHVWKWFAIGKDAHPSAWVRGRRFALLALLAWLCLHFLTGGVF